MRRITRLITGTAVLLGGAAVLAAALLLAAPRYLNRPDVRRSIEETIARQVSGRVTIERINVVLRPFPSIVFEGVDVTAPKSFVLASASVSVGPRLRSLLQGRFLVSRVRLQQANIAVLLPEKAVGGPVEGAWLRNVESAAQATGTMIAQFGYGVRFDLDGGEITLTSGGRPVGKVNVAAARIEASPGMLLFDLRGAAAPWDEIGLRGLLRIDERGTTVEDLGARLGRSEVSGLSARIDWGRLPGFTVREGKARLALEELFSGASSFRFLQPYLRNLRTLRGEAVIRSISAEGQFSNRRSWRWNASGQLEDVVLASDWLPDAFSASGEVAWSEQMLSMKGLSASIGRSSLSGASVRIDWARTPRLHVLSARAVISVDDLNQWRTWLGIVLPKDFSYSQGTIKFASFACSGPLFSPLDWTFAAKGSVENIAVTVSLLPDRILLRRGVFILRSGVWSFSGLEAESMGASLRLAGSLRGVPAGLDGASVSMEGSIGTEAMGQIAKKLSLPRYAIVRTPVQVEAMHLEWQKPSALSMKGTMKIDSGPALAIDLRWVPGLIDVRNLTVSDSDSNAVIGARFTNEGRELSFTGNLAQATLHRILESQPDGPGRVQGDLHVRTSAGPALHMEAHGSLEARDIDIPWERKPSLSIGQLSVTGQGDYVVVQKGEIRLADVPYYISGTVAVEGRRITIDGNAASGVVNVSDLTGAFSGTHAESTGSSGERNAEPSFTVDGVVRVKAGELIYGAYRFHDVQAQTAFGPSYLSATFTRANMCGLLVPGTVLYDRGRWQFDVQVAGAGEVSSMLGCLAGEKLAISGTYMMTAALRARGETDGLMPHLEGTVELSARDGKIYRYPLLAKVLSILSVTEVLRGKVPELGGSGFPYHTMTLKAVIEQGRLKLQEAMIDGTSVTIVADGEVDIPSRDADLVVLVAPFSTVNWIIRHIPIVGRILGGTLISIPVKVTGDISDPKVVFLAPSAVGERIVSILENTVKLPVDLISPLIPGTDGDGK